MKRTFLILGLLGVVLGLSSCSSVERSTASDDDQGYKPKVGEVRSAY